MTSFTKTGSARHIELSEKDRDTVTGTRTENFVKFGHAVSNPCGADSQTDPHTYRHTDCNKTRVVSGNRKVSGSAAPCIEFPFPSRPAVISRRAPNRQFLPSIYCNSSGLHFPSPVPVSGQTVTTLLPVYTD